MSHFFIYLFCYVAKVISENWNLEAHGFSLFPRNNTFVCVLKTQIQLRKPTSHALVNSSHFDSFQQCHHETEMSFVDD